MEPNESLNSPQTKTPPVPLKAKKHTKRNIIILVSILVLLGAGTGAWWFFIKPDNSQPAAPQTDQPTETTQKDPASLYFNVAQDGRIQNLTTLNVESGKSSVLYEADEYEYIDFVELEDGTLRYLLENIDGNTYTLALQDNDGEPRVILKETVSASDNTFHFGPLSPDGNKAYFYEQESISGSKRIATVDEKGTVEIVTDYGTLDKEKLRVQRALVPVSTDQDETVIYLRETALNADTSSPGNIIAYDVASKAFRLVFEDPVKDKPSMEPEHGFWERLNETYAYVFTTTRPNMSLSEFTYEKIRDGSDWLYLVNLETGKSIEVFHTSGEDTRAHPLQLSADGKTFYFYTERAIKQAQTLGDGHGYELATNKYLAYDLETGKTTALGFEADGTKTRPAILTSTGGTYVLGLSYRLHVEQNASDAEPHTSQVYTSPMSQPGPLKKMFESHAGRYNELIWAGFAQE